MINKVVNKLKASWNSMMRHPKALILVTIFVSVLSTLFILIPAHAQGTMSQGVFQDYVIGTLIRIMLAITRFALQIMTFILTFIIEIAAYNGYLSSDAVSVGWIMVRDLTNMVFVVALLMIAFGTILGVENYEWKSMLFKLVSAAILVNFSRIIAGIIIDVAQVVMITFVNGIAATVGGNFIQAFDLTRLRSFSQTTTGDVNNTAVFLAAVASMFIAITVAATTAVMLFMLIARVILLWVLVVLSPIAFSLSVLPKTQPYAKQWWDEFGKQVLTGPILVFFLWLTLVAVGNGTVSQHFYDYSSAPNRISASNDALNGDNAGIGQATSWSNLVNFAIAIGFLVVGIKVTQQMGGYGAEWTGKALDFGKRWTSRLSGFSAARAGAQKGAELAKAGGKAIGLAAGKQVYTRFGGKQLEGQYYRVRSFFEDRARINAERAGDVAKAAYGVDKKTGKYEKGFWTRLGAKARLATMRGGAEIQEDRISKAKREFEAKQAIRKDHTASTSGLDFGYRVQGAEADLATREKYGGEIKEGRKQTAVGRQERAISVIGEERVLNAELDKVLSDKDAKNEDVIEVLKKDPSLMSRLQDEGFETDTQLHLMLGNYRRSLKGADEKTVGAAIGREVKSADEVRAAQAEEEYRQTAEGRSREVKTAGREARAKHIQEKSANQKDLRSIQAIDRYLKSPEGERNHDHALRLRARRDAIEERVKRRTERSKLEQEKASTLFRERAETEYETTENINPERLKAIAKAKDDVLIGQGLPPRYFLSTWAAEMRRIGEQFTSLKFPEIMDRAVNYSSRLGAVANDPDSDEYKKRAANVLGSLTACLSQGAEGLVGVARAAQVNGFNETVAPGDHDATLRELLTAASGSYVQRGQTQDAWDKMVKTHGEGWDLFMRGWEENSNKVAEEAASAWAGGAVDNRGRDKNTGMIHYAPIAPDQTAVSEGNQDYRGAVVKPDRVKSLSGMVTSRVTNQGHEVTKNADEIDVRSLKNFILAFQKMRRTTTLDPRFVKEWQGYDDGVKSKLISALRNGLVGQGEDWEKGFADAADILEEKLKKGNQADNGATDHGSGAAPAPTPKPAAPSSPETPTPSKEEKKEEKGEAKKEESKPASILYDAYNRPVSGPPETRVHKEFNDRLYREEMLKAQKATKKAMDETKKSIDDLSRALKSKGGQSTGQPKASKSPKKPTEEEEEEPEDGDNGSA